MARYQRRWLAADVTAGLLIVAVAIPLSMGMAEVAGLPPVVGLYSCMLPLVGYALLGTSHHLVLGLDASTAAMLAGAVAPLADGDPARYAALAGTLTLLVGGFVVLASVARLGVIADLLSAPALLGYQAGLAVTVIVNQLPRLVGVPGVNGDTVERVRHLITAGDDVHLPTLAVGVGVGAVIVALRRFPRVPTALIAVVGATALTALPSFGGLTSVGVVPSGLRQLRWPALGLDDLASLCPAALAISLVASADTLAASRAFASRSGYHVNVNRELAGLGLANTLSSVSGGITVSASAARTAIAEASHSHTPLASIVSAVGLAVVVVSLTGLLESVPVAALAAVVIVAVARLIELRAAARLARRRPAELGVCLATAAGVVAFGVLQGMIVAVALSILALARRAMRPHDAIVGQDRDQDFVDLADVPHAALESGLTIYRFEAPLFHGNIDRFRRRVEELTSIADPPLRWLVIDASPITDIDVTAADAIAELTEDLRQRGITLAFAELVHPVRRDFSRYGLDDIVGAERLFDSLADAVAAFHES